MRVQCAQQRGRRRQRGGQQRGAPGPAGLARSSRVRDQAVAGTPVHSGDGERRDVSRIESAAVGSKPQVYIFINQKQFSLTRAART